MNNLPPPEACRALQKHQGIAGQGPWGSNPRLHWLHLSKEQKNGDGNRVEIFNHDKACELKDPGTTYRSLTRFPFIEMLSIS